MSDARFAPLRRLAGVLALLAAAGCHGGGGGETAPGPPRAELEAVVSRDGLLLDPAADVPGEALEVLAGARLVLLGETHYVLEHQRFLVASLPALHARGIRWLLQEEMVASGWEGEEYVQGRSARLSTQIAAFEQPLLEGLRAFNAGLVPAERIHFAAIDVNHWADLFQGELREFQARFGEVAVAGPILAETPGSAGYAAALAAFAGALAADAAALQATLGAERYALLVDLVEGERSSAGFRASGRFDARELFMRGRILRALAEAGGAGVAVNTGASHAQKTNQEGLGWEPLGTWLASHPAQWGGEGAAVVSLGFFPARGTLLSGFADPVGHTFDVRAAPANDLARVMAERAGERILLLPMRDPIFSAALELDAGGRRTVLAPARSFDTLVLYPEATVLPGLSIYRGTPGGAGGPP